MTRKVRKRNASKGKRYSSAEKRAVLDHVERVNRDRGRGGISSAARHFGVSPLTISNWLRSEGAGAPVSGKRPKVSAEDFRRMAELHERIIEVEAELQNLRNEYAQLKGKL